MTVSYETQVVPEDDGSFSMTVTIATAIDSTWTSQPVELSARTSEEAHVEADGKVRALAAALSAR
jgi:hypothetical protein